MNFSDALKKAGQGGSISNPALGSEFRFNITRLDGCIMSIDVRTMMRDDWEAIPGPRPLDQVLEIAFRESFGHGLPADPTWWQHFRGKALEYGRHL